MSTSPDELTFEEALERLEHIVQDLEEGTFTLKESVASYAEGVELAQMCLERLKTAELRIEELQLDDEL